MSTSARQLRTNLGQSASELRQFVASLKGKSPGEAMGVVAQSHLARALIVSAAVHLVALLVLTIPFALMVKRPPRKSVVETPPPAVMPATQPSSTAPAPRPVMGNGKAPAEDPASKVMRTDVEKGPKPIDDVDKLIDKMR